MAAVDSGPRGPVERFGRGVDVDPVEEMEVVRPRRGGRGIDESEIGVEDDAGGEIRHLDARVDRAVGAGEVMRIAEVGEEEEVVRRVDRQAVGIDEAAGSPVADQPGGAAEAVAVDVNREDAGVDGAAAGCNAVRGGIVGLGEVELVRHRAVDELAQEVAAVGVGRGVDRCQRAAADAASQDLLLASADGRVVGDEVEAVGRVEGDSAVEGVRDRAAVDHVAVGGRRR